MMIKKNEYSYVLYTVLLDINTWMCRHSAYYKHPPPKAQEDQCISPASMQLL